MKLTLSDRERQFLALFEDETGATARDCVVVEDEDETDGERVLIVVKAGDMATAIGPGGEHVRRVEDRLGRAVHLVEDAPDAEGFVANALAPAAVYNVTISRNDDVVAYAEVDSADKGVAIGSGGRNIQDARLLAKRHFDVDDVQLT